MIVALKKKEWVAIPYLFCMAFILFCFIFLGIESSAKSLEGKVMDSGECGDGLNWEIKDGGILVISGNGGMKQGYAWSYPWSKYQGELNTLVIEEGVRVLPKNAFGYHKEIKTIVFLSKRFFVENSDDFEGLSPDYCFFPKGYNELREIVCFNPEPIWIAINDLSDVMEWKKDEKKSIEFVSNIEEPQADAVKVSNVEELSAVTEGSYYLSNNITISKDDTWEGITPSGKVVFDGQGFTITNESGNSLFNTISHNCSISNLGYNQTNPSAGGMIYSVINYKIDPDEYKCELNITNCCVTGVSSCAGFIRCFNAYSHALYSFFTNEKYEPIKTWINFDNCISKINILSSGEYAGGFVGELYSFAPNGGRDTSYAYLCASFSNCRSNVRIAGVTYAGGFVGRSRTEASGKGDFTFSNCSVYGEVQGSVCGGYIGYDGTRGCFFNCDSFCKTSQWDYRDGGNYIGTGGDDFFLGTNYYDGELHPLGTFYKVNNPKVIGEETFCVRNDSMPERNVIDDYHTRFVLEFNDEIIYSIDEKYNKNNICFNLHSVFNSLINGGKEEEKSYSITISVSDGLSLNGYNNDNNHTINRVFGGEDRILDSSSFNAYIITEDYKKEFYIDVEVVDDLGVIQSLRLLVPVVTNYIDRIDKKHVEDVLLSDKDGDIRVYFNYPINREKTKNSNGVIRIYGVDYSGKRIEYRKYVSEKKAGDSEDAFYIDDDDPTCLVMDIMNGRKDIIGKNRKAIPHGADIFLTMDPNLVYFEDESKQFMGISELNPIEIKTCWGLTTDVDLLSFDNNKENYDDEKYTLSYTMRSILWNVIGRYGNNHTESMINAKLLSDWHGACEGMVNVIALSKVNSLNLKKYNAYASNAFLLPLPGSYDGKLAYGSRDIIYYYHLLQYLDHSEEVYPSNIVNNFFANKDKWRSNISGIVGILRKSLRPLPIIINFDYYSEEKKKVVKGEGHAVLAYALKEDELYYKIYVYDPSYPTYSTILLFSKTKDDVFLQGALRSDKNDVNEKMCKVTAIGYIDIDKMNKFNPDSFKNCIYDIKNSATTMLCIGVSDFCRIVNSKGEYIDYANGVLSGTMNIYNNKIVGAGLSKSELCLEVDNSDKYEYISNGEGSLLAVSQNEFYFQIDTEALNLKTSIIPEKEVIISNINDNDYAICTTHSKNDTDMVSYVGHSDSDIKLKYETNGDIEMDASSNIIRRIDTIKNGEKTIIVNNQTGYRITDITNSSGNSTPAIVSGINVDELYSGETCFTINCSKPCVVAYSTDNGKTYSKLHSIRSYEDSRDFVLTVNSDTMLFVGLMGDTLLDGKVGVADAKQIKRYAANLRTLTPEQILVSDVTGDGFAKVVDAKQIKRYCANLRSFEW